MVKVPFISSGGSADPGDGNLRGIVLVLAAFFVFAVQDAITKQLTQSLAVPQILLIRYVAFAAFVTWWAARRIGLKQAIGSKRPVLQIFRSLLIVLEIGIFAYGVQYIPLADMHAVFAAAPLIVTALSVPLLREPVGVRRWAAVIVGFGGVLIILRPGMGVMHPAAIYSLIAAAMFALYIILTRKVSAGDKSETSIFYMGWTGLIASAVVGPFFWETPDQSTWILLLCLSCTSIAGHILFTMALEAAPAAILQPFQYSVLVWAAILGIVIFGDIPDTLTIVGALIVAASGIYTVYRERVRMKKIVQPPRP